MIKNKKVEFRATEGVVSYLEDMCKRYSMTKSEYMRKAIYGGFYDMKEFSRHLVAAQQIIDKIIIGRATEEDLDVLIGRLANFGSA